MSTAGWQAERLNPLLTGAAVLTGCGAVHLLPSLFSPLWLIPPLVACLYLAWKRPQYSAMPVALLMAAYTLFMAQQRLDLQIRQKVDTQFSGWITGIPESGGPDGSTWRLMFKTDEQPSRLLRLSWYDAPAALSRQNSGQCLRIQARLRPPRGMANPGIFDYEAWLLRHNISATGYIRNALRCPERDRGGLDSWRADLSAQITATLTAAGMPEIVGLTAALLLGERSDISDVQWQVLRRTGTSHLVAISGLHIGLLATAVFWLCRILAGSLPALCLRWPAQRWAAIAAMPAATAYALMSGFELPAQRALIMVLVGLLAICTGGLHRPLFPLCAALVFVLLLDPFAPLAPGFWLSFGAVSWILLLLSGRQSNRGPGIAWRKWIYLQLGLTAALTPLCLLWFQEASWIAAPANLLLIPLLGLYLPVLVFAGIPVIPIPGLSDAVLPLLIQPLAWAWGLLAATDARIIGSFSLATPNLAITAVACTGLLLLLAPRGVPGRLCGILLLVPLLWPWKDPLPHGQLEMRTLDVGQGLAVVLRTRHHNMIYDAGPRYRGGFDTGEAVVAPSLLALGINRLNGVLISHRDIDHRGGLAAVRKRIGVEREINTTSDNRCVAGAEWVWDGVHFRILHPDERGPGIWNDNNGSCVLRISAGPHSLLLTGDIERRAEAALMRRYAPGILQSTVLVAPHHGSASSSSAAFVEATRPRHVIFAASLDNRWGFPKPAVRNRYSDAGSQTWQTGLHGMVTARIGQGLPEAVIQGIGAQRGATGAASTARETDPQPVIIARPTRFMAVHTHGL